MLFNPRNNSRASPSRRPRTSQPAASTDHWAVVYAKTNPLKVGTAASTVYGLFIIFGYHTYIEYYSAFDINSLASLIFAAAYVGLLVLVGLSFGLFAPTYFIGAFCIDDESCRTADSLYRRIAICFSIAFLAFESLFAIVCFFGDKTWAGGLILAVPIAIYFLYTFLSAPWRKLKQAFHCRLSIARASDGWIGWRWARMIEVVRNVPTQYKSKVKLGGSMTFACIVEVFALETFLIMTRDSSIMQEKTLDWFKVATAALTVGILIQIAGAYLVGAWRNREGKRKHRIFSVVAVLLVPIFAPWIAGVSTPLFSLTSMLTKTGNFRVAEMTLDDDGCRVVADHNRPLCIKTLEGTNKLCNVHVMSRIGSETYMLLSYPAAVSTDKTPLQNDSHVERIGDRIIRHVYIPSKDILGIKPDLAVRVFTKEVIKNSLTQKSSICDTLVTKKAESITSVSFSEKDLFEFDQYVLTDQGREALTAFVQHLIRDNGGALSIEVTGHTDQLGSPYHNLSLSQLRAIEVANFLRYQLDGKSLQVKMNLQGVGSSRAEVPESACPSSMARAERIACFARNRRVDINVARL